MPNKSRRNNHDPGFNRSAVQKQRLKEREKRTARGVSIKGGPAFRANNRKRG